MSGCGCSQQGSIARPCCAGCAASGSACGGKCGGTDGAVDGAPRHYYRVREGDTPMAIAQRLTGVGARMSELVAANPQKARVGSTFQSMSVGEKLALPNHWGGGTLQGLGRRLQGLGSTSTDAQAAANALSQYIQQNGCDCSAALCALGTTFQVAYNAGVNDGTYNGVKTASNPGPTLTVDGKYGSDTNLAFAEVMGSAPSPCWSAGNPCAGQPCGGSSGGTTTLPPVTVGSGPTGAPPPSGGTAAPPASQSSSSTAAIVAGIALVAVGGGALYYMHKHPPHGHGLRARST